MTVTTEFFGNTQKQVILKQQSYQAWLAEDAGLQDFQDFPATSKSVRGESWRHKIPGFELKSELEV